MLKVIEELKSEMDEISLKRTEAFLELEVNSDSFLHEFNHHCESLDKDENSERDRLIIKMILLGMGRNRTINILKDYKVTRTIFERVRDCTEVNSSKLKKANEKKITSMKWESKARSQRMKKLTHVDWDSVKNEYLSGESIVSLSNKYNLDNYAISSQLEDEGLTDETRSTLNKRNIADSKFKEIKNSFIKKLVDENPLDSKELLWKKAKEIYPWLLRRQMYDKLEDLGLIKTEDEVNEIRRIKSKTESNESYTVKVNGYKAVKEVFGSVDNIVEQYMDNSLGSFNKIADKINNEISFDYEISTKQVSKIITRHSSYVRKNSLGQKQLYHFIKETFKKYNVIEEYYWNETSNKKIDVYVQELKIGFEFNGEYWHSDPVINYNYGKNSFDFHKERVQEVSEEGIKLLYIWEDDWNRNYKEVEKAIIDKKWDSEILNKYENKTSRSSDYWSPNKQPSLLRRQVLRFLKNKKIEYTKENNSHLIELNKHNIIINIPNYNSLQNEKECLNLQKLYEEKDIELLTFLPWRDIYKIKEFLSYRLKLKSVSKIAARKCQVVFNDGITKEQKDFFANNHLLGYESNFKHIDKTVSLIHNGKVVMSALFVRKDDSKIVELKRLVSSYGLSIQGGASKLLKSYVRETKKVDEIQTFSDCDLGFGSVYKALGFKQTIRSKEQLNWYNEDLEMKFSNRSLIIIGADRLLRKIPNYTPVGIDEGLPSNQEIVQNYGFVPIYDSGYKKWSLKI